ncbi:MAG: hypothetical protein PUI24_08060 [Spirochaetales bacterium]|nr:hypothetical protein [Spirochaetales bacterium]
MISFYLYNSAKSRSLWFATRLCDVQPYFFIAAALVLEIKPMLLPPRIAEMPENPSRESLQKRVSCKKRHFAVKSEYEK